MKKVLAQTNQEIFEKEKKKILTIIFLLLKDNKKRLSNKDKKFKLVLIKVIEGN